MKFLVQNYSSEYSTQALYLSRCLNEQEEYSSVLWNNSCSLYDIMDKEKPDYFITSAFMLSKDFVYYVNSSNFVPRDIKLLLNIDGVSQDVVNSLENSLVSNNIKCPFFFSNNHNIKTNKIRLVNINNAYDVYLSQKSTIQYNIGKAIIINSKEQATKYDGSYHILAINNDLSEVADIVLPESRLCALYHNYDEIIVHIEDIVPQAFFNAIMYGNKVYYKSSNKEVKTSIEKLLRTDASLDYDDANRQTDFSEIKKTVKERHSSYNRVKTLLSQLPKD